MDLFGFYAWKARKLRHSKVALAETFNTLLYWVPLVSGAGLIIIYLVWHQWWIGAMGLVLYVFGFPHFPKGSEEKG